MTESSRTMPFSEPSGATAGLPPAVFLMVNTLETGGSERQFAALVRSLDADAFDVHPGCIRKTGAGAEAFADIPQFRLGGSLYGLKSFEARFRLARHLRHFDIAVAHAFDFYTNLTLAPAARLARVPVVIGSQRQLGDLLSPAQRRAQGAAFRLCDRVVCNSHAARERLLREGVAEEKVVVIGNGLPPGAFAATAPALPPRPGVLRVGMISRMNSRAKNHLSFLRAAASLRGKFPGVEWVLLGDGPLRPELEHAAAELGLGEAVRFLGDRSDVTPVLASLDVSVLPSASESLSNAILESLAAGVPVVAARVGGNPELVEEGRGLLVDPGDEAALPAALGRLLTDRGLRAQCGQNGRRFALENFTLERMRTRHEELYSELLARKRWRPRITQVRSAPGRPLKVAVVAASLRYVGGQSAQADLLCRLWQDDPAAQARLIPVDPPFPRWLRWAELVPFLRTAVREPIYLASLWRGLKGADVAHIFAASYWSFLVAPAPALVLAHWRGCKTLIHYHSGEARDHLRRFRTARPVLARAARLVVPSGYLVEVFREFNLDARIVPNVVDLEQFKFRERKPLRPLLICTRGFHPYYSVDRVVRAFAAVKEKYPSARLSLVGKGPSEEQIRTLVRSMGLTDVTFTGAVSRHEIGRCYDDADIFINSSWLDNMPVSILEAFASGTPVVSSAPEGIRHVVEHERTGLLSEPGDWKALAANVIRLLDDGELAAGLASRAYQESKRYTWDAVRAQWLEVYLALVSGRAPAPAPLAAGQALSPASEAGAAHRETTLIGSP